MNDLSLSASISGGTYDSISYAWEVVSGGGSISGSGLSATYYPPNVSSDRTVTVRITATAIGTGNNYQSGSSDTSTDTESFTVLVYIAPPSDTTPSRPAAPTLQAKNSTTLRVMWVEPFNGGATITSYDLQYREIGTTDWSNVNNQTDLTHDITLLTANTEYEVQVRATNSEGPSSYSPPGEEYTGRSTLTLGATGIDDIDGRGMFIEGDHLYTYAEKSNVDTFVAWNWPARTRSAAQDIVVGTDIQGTLHGVTSDSENVYQSTGGTIYRYSFEAESVEVLASADFPLANDNADAHGMVIQGDRIFVVDDTALSIFPYTLAGAALAGEKRALDDANHNPGGIAADATYWWVTDVLEDKVFRYERAVAASTIAIKFMVSVHGRLWGITSKGQLYQSSDLASDGWTIDAKIPTFATPVTGMVVYRDSSDEPAIFVTTETGLWIHNVNDMEFLEATEGVPRSDRNGYGMAVWRSTMYYANGLSVRRFRQGGGGAVIDLVGPDRDDGIPWDGDSYIAQLIPTLNVLVAVVRNVEPNSPTPVGTSHILGYNGTGWFSIWTPSDHQVFSQVLAQQAYGQYQAFISYGDRIAQTRLSEGLVNPSVVDTHRDYASAGALELPWYDANEIENDKVAYRIRADVQGASETEVVTLKYRLADAPDTLHTIGRITSNGRKTFPLPAGLDEDDDLYDTGLAFESLRFRIEMESADPAQSPDLQALVMEYDKFLEERWGFQITFDLNDRKKAKALKESLRAARNTKRKMRLYYQYDEDGEPIVYTVKVDRITIAEQTGSEDQGRAVVFLIEV